MNNENQEHSRLFYLDYKTLGFSLSVDQKNINTSQYYYKATQHYLGRPNPTSARRAQIVLLAHIT